MHRIIFAQLLPVACLFACAEASPPSAAPADANTPYTLGQALVIGQSESGELLQVDESCESAACEAVRERCGEQAYADVIVDEGGQVLDVLCFRGNAAVQEIGDAPIESASAGNDTVLVLDGADDGADVTGSVVLTGNNAVIYGRGAAVSRIGGDLSLDKNNAIVRGVSIGGDVTISKNNAQLSFAEIHGDLIIEGNNTTLAECVVHGQVRIDGVNTVLVNNRFAGARSLSAKNLECNGNTGFEPATLAGGGSDAGASGAAGDAADATDAGAGAGAEIACTSVPGGPRGHGRF